jgi:tetratricopeptide (TPR) repeat protein
MSLRKEHVVLLGSVAVLGLLGWSATKERVVPRGAGSKNNASVEFEHYPAPDAQFALGAPRKLAELDRDLFSQPRDTHPLPPLVTLEPPLPTLSALRPLTSYTVSPPFFGRLLRADPTPVSPAVPKLFNTGAEGETSEDDVAEASEPSAKDLLNQSKPTGELETPEQHAAKLESWKKLYDWIRVTEGEPLFGQIRNPDRYGLKGRAGEAVSFVEVLPQTGVERFPGQKPVTYMRDRVLEFAFADTASNRIQLRRREFVAPIGPSRYQDLLAFADECVAARLDAREALSVAADMYELASQTEPADPTPQIGLARCYEAGFELEKAFDVYTRLLAAGGVHPEVRVGLAQLEAKLRLFDRAEAHFKEAFAQARTQWNVLWPYGRFAFHRGHYDDALANLNGAFADDNNPTKLADARTRAAIRTDLGAALTALARIDDAQDKFDKALQADPSDPRPLAGKLSSAYYSKKAPAAASAGAAGNDAGFEMLMARAMLDCQAKNWVPARDQLISAASADALRAPRAWAGLSWLAEITGYPENAGRFIEQAAEGDPSDPWIRYQHGRMLAARDDVQGAHDEFVAALDLQLDFVDAIIALGALAHRTGAYEDAERYLERALFLDNTRAEIHALRGWNFVELNDLASARDAFDAALQNDKMQPLARAGQAWTTYLAGDSEKAISLFAELNDVRRSLPENDPYRVYAQAQMDRIKDHESKVIWNDRFERRALMNNWGVDEATGPTVTLVDGAVHIAGNFNTNGAARLHKPYPATDFVSAEMDVTITSKCNARVSVYLSKEKRTGGQNQIVGKIAVARRRDGGLVVLAMDVATAEENWEDVAEVGGKPWWPLDQPVRLRIERLGEGSDSTVRLSVDGITVREGIRMQRMSSSNSELNIGVAVEGQTGLPADVVVDNVDVVYRIPK